VAVLRGEVADLLRRKLDLRPDLRARLFADDRVADALEVDWTALFAAYCGIVRASASGTPSGGRTNSRPG